MRKTRVLLVDDSPLIRRVVTDALNADPSIEVVGTAGDGLEGLKMIARTRPDLVVLDVDMPRLNGIETLRKIRERSSRLPVVMFSNLTQRGAQETLEALELGANDYITKPQSLGGMSKTKEGIRRALGPRIRAFCRTKSLPGGVKLDQVPQSNLLKPKLPPPAANARPDATPRTHGGTRPVDVLCIAISTGGPPALRQLLRELPANLPVPVLVVQHMPPVYTKSLAQRLDLDTELQVCEAEAGQTPEPGHVYIAPGGFHMVVEGSGTARKLQTNQDPEVESCRPAADVLFGSVAISYGDRSLGLVMTGMGRDGLNGSRALVAAGGQVLAQDEASSAVYGMPRAVVEAGLTPAGIPLDDIARVLCERLGVAPRAGD